MSVVIEVSNPTGIHKKNSRSVSCLPLCDEMPKSVRIRNMWQASPSESHRQASWPDEANTLTRLCAQASAKLKEFWEAEKLKTLQNIALPRQLPSFSRPC